MLTKWYLLKSCLFLLTAIFSIVIFNSCEEKSTDPAIDRGEIQLKILFPNGGESLTIDSIYTIQWQSQGIKRINIFYSADNGTTWQLISENQDASIGQYLWTIPDNITDYGLVKITLPDHSPLDVSDSNFSIGKSALSLLFPNGGESLKIDSIYTTISWHSQDIENINIFYSADSGANWQMIAENQNASIGKYLWKIPGIPTNYGLVRISTTDASLQDISDSSFQISFSPEYVKEVIKYYPLNIGYVWVSVVNIESWYDPTHNWHYIIRKEILKDSLINDNKFFLVSEISIPQDTIHIVPSPHYSWIRVDSSEGLIYVLGYDNKERIFIDLKMRVGDIIGGDFRVEVLSEEITEVLGIWTDVKKYKKTDIYQSYLYDFAKEIGQIRYKINGDSGTDIDKLLKGAVIDNVIYGDTTTTL